MISFSLSLQGIRTRHALFQRRSAHTYLIRLKSNERQAVSAVKFEIQLGVKKQCFLCTQHEQDVLLQQASCCAARRREKRWGRGEEGNCHIKGKEFKINLISQSLSPPKRLAVSMLRLVMRHKESTEAVKWRWWGTGRGDWLLHNQNEGGEVSHRIGHNGGAHFTLTRHTTVQQLVTLTEESCCSFFSEITPGEQITQKGAEARLKVCWILLYFMLSCGLGLH